MSDDPRSIADRLVISETCTCSECKVARAAAVLLRRHADLLDAIGDPADFVAEAESWMAYVPAHFMEKWNAAGWGDQVRRIAAAVQPPDPKD
jgi:hypothetical protein